MINELDAKSYQLFKFSPYVTSKMEGEEEVDVPIHLVAANEGYLAVAVGFGLHCFHLSTLQEGLSSFEIMLASAFSTFVDMFPQSPSLLCDTLSPFDASHSLTMANAL